ncbi:MULTISPECIES: HupE/UreJ family protein [Stutzerimonas stutzeri subgroup]|jgi:urease accessory protein|uniref:Hydantoin utilization protein A n=1 Tax=Stutzerimonas stutzeri TaxID=316 RepID=A0A6I6LU52_STUST|nr:MULTISPECIES: HupE/UreJ family protein [Stutzerimonas stutzeri subgroup]QGZ32780.1 hydantoin utilization protein A [Stutzerimonas stutzeri]HBO6208430.1 hydantoin utilization protein A [Pseudomonas aeruginosa]
MSRFSKMLAGKAISLFAIPGYAHHPTGGELPGSILYGVLSGVGHPLIDLTHIVFILGMGLLFALHPGSVGKRVVLFLAATWIGALGHLLGMDVQAAEALMALGIIVAGLMLMLRQFAILPGILGLAAITGIIHGFAYAEDVIGARTGPLMGYFFGFTLIQAVVLSATAMVGRTWVKTHAPGVVRRWAFNGGAVFTGLGLLLLAS